MLDRLLLRWLVCILCFLGSVFRRLGPCRVGRGYVWVRQNTEAWDGAQARRTTCWLCRRRTERQSPPCSLLIDGPANGLDEVQRTELRYATGGRLRTLVDAIERLDRLDAKLKSRPLWPCGCKNTAILPNRRQNRYAIRQMWMGQGRFCCCDGCAYSLSTTKGS